MFLCGACREGVAKVQMTRASGRVPKQQPKNYDGPKGGAAAENAKSGSWAEDGETRRQVHTWGARHFTRASRTRQSNRCALCASFPLPEHHHIARAMVRRPARRRERAPTDTPQSSSPVQSSRKRRRSPSNVHLGAGPSHASSDAGTPAALAASTPGGLSARSTSPPPSSLPPSSPPAAFSDMTDGEEEAVVDDEHDAERLGQAYEEDEDVEGEDLFAEGMEG